ncbi:hypothetical protein KIH74_30985 [Kineosporia sp. J2-2]|uniref:DUF4267 domain-containing protein n=1 Tax=Kineosporia corallincola TaxID=2835133 RepID=A0ABS5TRJ0_9ACTN|nr:hypothetical protein [Kineosporia corallincola]MBT0773412.1 hypothetical protein [Kineosporia corallincola]
MSNRVIALAGAAFGAALLLRPAGVIRAVGADPATPGLLPAARVLGARHLAQAAAVGLRPGAPAGWAVLIDTLHAASMIGLAAVAPGHRRAALASAAVAGALGAGQWASRPQPGGSAPGVSTSR